MLRLGTEDSRLEEMGTEPGLVAGIRFSKQQEESSAKAEMGMVSLAKQTRLGVWRVPEESQ